LSANKKPNYYLLQNTTRYVIAEAFANIAFSIVSAKSDALRDASSIWNT